MRVVLRAPGRRARVLMPGPRRRRRGPRRPDRRGALGRRGAAPRAARVRRNRRGAVRLLHAGTRRRDVRAAHREPRALGPRGARGAVGEHLPLHRLRQDPRGGPARFGRDVPAMSTSAPRVRIRGVVGESVERPDAVPKVKGEFEYASDLRRDGMLFGATLRSPHAYARIAGIETSAAKRMSGVRAVITSGELPTRERFGLMKLDQPVLATERVRYVGEPVAIVAADSAEEARLALAGVGGAFGAREDVTLQIHTCLLALATRRPVRMTYGREESFYGHVHRHPAKLFYAHGATKRGELVFVRATIVLDGGAYASSSPAVIANAACFGAGPYRVPNARIHAVGAYTNNPPAGAMRGFGAVQSCFAYEGQMDALAAKLGIDPVELRERNALRNGDPIITSQPVEGSAPVAEIVRRCADAPLPPRGPETDPIALPGGAGNLTHGEGVRRGVGFAVGMKNVCYSHGFDDFATARVRLMRDERGPLARVHTAAAEVGQGLVTVCVQIVRTELGVERAELDPPDTTIGSAGSSSASRQTWMTGGAVLAACREVKAVLLSRARAAGRPPDDLAALLDEPIDKTVSHRHRDTEPRDAATQNAGHVAFLFAAHRAVADVDIETGLIKVVQIATAQDVGKAINPLAVVGQIEGGIAQGLGLAVMEEVILKDGHVRNASFTDYLLPTTLDMPPVVTLLIEHPLPAAPFGAQGVGVPPTISSTPAIVAAIRAATGRTLHRVPVRPDDIVFDEPYRSGWRIKPGDDPRRAVPA